MWGQLGEISVDNGGDLPDHAVMDRDFEINGYRHVAGVWSKSVMRGHRGRWLAELQDSKKSLIDDIGGKHHAILAEPRLLQALHSILGRPFLVVPPCSCDHNRFGGFHTDTTGMEMAGYWGHKASGFNVVVLGIYLQDNNECGGGLRVVPGSHKLPDPFVKLTREKHELRAKLASSRARRLVRKATGGLVYGDHPAFANMPGQIDVPTRQGDALIWDLRLIHRASPKRRKGDDLIGGKIALFFTLAQNNPASAAWCDYYGHEVKRYDRPPQYTCDDYVVL